MNNAVNNEWQQFVCEVSGSNPSATIDWWLDDVQLSGTEAGIEITSQNEMSNTRFNAPAFMGTLKVKVTEKQANKDLECRIKYNQTYIMELAKKVTLQYLESQERSAGKFDWV